MDPNISSGFFTLYKLVLQRAIQLGVELVSHEKASEIPRKLRSKAHMTAFPETTAKRGRYSVKLMFSETPIPVIMLASKQHSHWHVDTNTQIIFMPADLRVGKVLIIESTHFSPVGWSLNYGWRKKLTKNV